MKPAKAMHTAEKIAADLQRTLAHTLKTKRLEQGYTQAALAEKLLTHKSAIARFENPHCQHSSSLLTLVKYAHFMGYRLDFKLVRHT